MKMPSSVISKMKNCIKGDTLWQLPLHRGTSMSLLQGHYTMARPQRQALARWITCPEDAKGLHLYLYTWQFTLAFSIYQSGGWPVKTWGPCCLTDIAF